MSIDVKYMVDLFLNYVTVDTQADANISVIPTTKGQWDMAEILSKECEKIGLSDVKTHKTGYVTATLKSNTDKKVPAIGLLAHMDTALDASGKDIKPRVIENYNGEDIKLDSGPVMSVDEFPGLKLYKGMTLIVTDGTTLLGGDDKAGIVEILAAMKYLIENPDIKHGDIRIAFTPDEEIGTGMNGLDAKDFGADFAYTIDGGPESVFNYETFNAAGSTIEISGKSIHTGMAKGIMKNAALIAAEIAWLRRLMKTRPYQITPSLPIKMPA